MPLLSVEWPYLVVFQRLALALAVGLFIGLERERRGKDAGVRTFGFAALLGALGGLLGSPYGLASILLLCILVIFLNLHTLRVSQNTELTTSIALLITGFVGILSGLGQTLTPAAVGVTTAALLAWKEPLSGFSIKLSEKELRSAILLAILAFVIYPALPAGAVGPWGVLEPRAAWLTILLIAGVGFVNYILLKAYGHRGVDLAGFLGGLVNSSVAVRELAKRSHEMHGQITEVTYRGILLAVAAMVARNAVLMGILDLQALEASALAFALMLAASLGLALYYRGRQVERPASPGTLPGGSELRLDSPFSLESVLKFGAIMVIIQIAGVLGQQILGHLGVYITTLLGSLFSSSSAVAAAATLGSHGAISASLAGTCGVIASITSALVNIPLVFGLGNRTLITRLVWSIGIVVGMGTLGAILQYSILS